MGKPILTICKPFPSVYVLFSFQQNVMREIMATNALLLVIASTTHHVIISTVAVLEIYVRLVGRVITAA